MAQRGKLKVTYLKQNIIAIHYQKTNLQMTLLAWVLIGCEQKESFMGGRGLVILSLVLVEDALIQEEAALTKRKGWV